MTFGVLAALVVALAGCGSTVPAGRIAGLGGGSLQATLGGKALGQPSSLATGQMPSTTNSSLFGSGSTGENPRVSGGGSVSGGSVSATGPGITNTSLYIGVPYGKNNGILTALGAAGAQPSYSTDHVTQAIIDYANKHGGFAGRRLKAIYYGYDATNDFSVQDQAACQHWTKDNKVFVVDAEWFAGTEILTQCAEKAGAIPIGAGAAIASTFARYPHLVDPVAIRLDRLASITASGLRKAKYFAGKLGIVTWDHPSYHYVVDHAYKPILSSFGVKVWATAYVQPAQSANDISAMSAGLSSAIARFHGQRIDHVIVQDGPAGLTGGGLLTLEWMYAAESQHYRPRYGQNVYNLPGDSTLPSDQQDRAIAIDQSDYDKKFDAGWHTNTARDLCYKIESDSGMPPQNNGDRQIMTHACDVVFFLQRVVNGLSVINADSFIQEVASLGTTFPSANIYGTKFFPGRRDGGDMVRSEEYFASCKCLRYKGPPYYAD